MCTGIVISYPEGRILARNMDYEHPLRYQGIYLPRHTAFGRDLMGQELSGPYAMLGMCFHGELPLKDGINEHGLMGITNMFITPHLYAADPVLDKVNISALYYMNYALSHYRDVVELIADLDRLHIAIHDVIGERVLCPEFHYYFVDRSNRSVVIAPHRQRLCAYENPYGVLTNSPALATHEKRLKKWLAGDPTQRVAKGLPGGFDPVSRFIRAYCFREGQVPARSAEEAVDHGFSILEALKLPRGFLHLPGAEDHTYTRYMCAYDNQSGKMYVRNHHQTRILRLNIEDCMSLEEKTLWDLPNEGIYQDWNALSIREML